MTLFFANVPNNCCKFCKKKKEKKTYYKLQTKTVYLYWEQEYFQELAFFMKRMKEKCSFCRNALHQSQIGSSS